MILQLFHRNFEAIFLCIPIHIPYLHEINTSFAGTNFSLSQYHFLVQCSIH